MSQHYEYPDEVFSRIDGIRDAPPVIRAMFLNIIKTVYFASLIAEEGEFVPIGLVVEMENVLEDMLDSDPIPDQFDDHRSWFVCRIAPIQFDPKNLKKIAHGIEYGRDLAVVTLTGDSLELTGIARRRRGTDGGDALRVAAPRPGAIVLEGRNRQLGMRYEAGIGRPNDVDVFDEPGVVLDALKGCGIGDHGWTLNDLLRHARGAGAGAMFLCVPTAGDVHRFGHVRYQFRDPRAIERLSDERQALICRRIAAAEAEGVADTRSIETRAQVMQDWEVNISAHAALVETVGRLAANDGAILVEPGFHIVGAGLIVSDLPATDLAMPTPTSCANALGTDTRVRPTPAGARHGTGLRFAWSVPGSVVFIVSSDGPVTVCAARAAS